MSTLLFSNEARSEGLSVLITGSSGFHGSHLTRVLVEATNRGEVAFLRLFDVAPHVDDSSYREIITERQQGDILKYEDVREACHGIDVVFHNAAVVDLGDKSHRLVEEVNVRGTENVVRACREKGVRCLIYTSSVDVVFTSQEGTEIEEVVEYPAESDLVFGTYGITKQRGEKIVLAANGAKTGRGDGKLVTCALRPTVMYGEEDPFNVPTPLKLAAFTFGYVIPVKGAKNQFQNTYAGNSAWAHVCAMKAALTDPSTVGGQAYFITDDTPAEPYSQFLEPFASRLGYNISSIGIPYWLLFGFAFVLEFVAWLMSPFVRMKLFLRVSALRGATSTHTYSRKKAEEHLGYNPLYGYEESIERSIPYYRKILKK
ncbi:3 beta-hydroxysteroid dehydrogenase type 7-like [Corticium candelabrum]|uniref:3 beta-hydroxysteroid dehydrogenase type 7-like n=1 Tax=Corticium candelabrum TaxID=121492 RepID=UPI002E26C170|nr:3 beta-hydroxysteroid dehydrogenase type 7-like [Corticium candelabrum]